VTATVVAGAFAWALLSAASAGAGGAWEVVHVEDDLVVQARAREESPIRELRAEGTVAAPPGVVRAVIADVERYPAFMPYVKASRVLAREPDGAVLVYQRLSFGALGLFVDDRDYVIRIAEHAWRTPEGAPVYRRRWAIAEAAETPPSERAVVRLAVNRGSWELGPADSAGARTRAVYCLFTDPGGALPSWLANQANRTGIPDVFAAVRKAASDARYAGATAPPPTDTAPRSAPGSCD
jgi:hypothetical protein